MNRSAEVVKWLLKLLVLENSAREQEAVARLTEMGYQSAEVDEALEWLSALAEPDHPVPATASRLSRRVLVGEELTRFDPAAAGLLLRLQEAGALTAADVDMVIEWLARNGREPVGPRKLREVLSRVVEDGGMVLALDGQDRARHLN
ncbi:MAG: DUF494 family protein [Candidatus Wallbacteria bacterium]|nr:DUF494 family protein [Candidatus Wallbacteria bacterium]